MRPPSIILCALSLAGCTANMGKPPQISYDELEPAVLEADPPKPVAVVEVPKLLPLPGQLKPMSGKATAAPEAKDPKERVAKANDAARVQPTRHDYLNAVQIYPFADGALYQVYAAPGQITDIGVWLVESPYLRRYVVGGQDPEAGRAAAAALAAGVAPLTPARIVRANVAMPHDPCAPSAASAAAP